MILILKSMLRWGNFTVFKVRIFVLSHQNKDQKLLSKTHLIHVFKFDLISNCFQGPLSLIPLGVFRRPGVWDCLQPALKHPRLWINTWELPLFYNAYLHNACSLKLTWNVWPRWTHTRVGLWCLASCLCWIDFQIALKWHGKKRKRIL